MRVTHLYATGSMLSVSNIILNNRHKNNGGVEGAVKWAIMSFSLVIFDQFWYSSSTLFFSNCLFSFGVLFWAKNVFKTGGKHCNVWTAHECGVFCMIIVSNSLHQAFDGSSAPVGIKTSSG